MRLTRGVSVAGVDPALAREVARLCHSGRASNTFIAQKNGISAVEAEEIVEALAEHGFLQIYPESGRWGTTVAGGALAQATFMKPLSRNKAEELLKGAIDRAERYNADPTKPLTIRELRVFGSYLDPEAAELGDLDLHLTTGPRHDGSDGGEAMLAYAEASGRTFGTFLARLAWGATELHRTIKGSSRYIHITEEPLEVFTDRWEIVFTATR